MTNYAVLYEKCKGTGLAAWADILPSQIDEAFFHYLNPHIKKQFSYLKSLPPITPSKIEFNKDCVTIGEKGNCDIPVQEEIRQILKRFHPWRKGPFKLFDIFIDSEWRSDLKWNRLKGKIMPLKGKRVLDVGCGNGYHCFRSIGEGADLVVGLDPFILYNFQFQAISHFINKKNIFHLPLKLESVPKNLHAFDTVFSMGVLYHCRLPELHLLKLKGCLKPGGELVLETLIIDGGPGDKLIPRGRYAKMKNVWFIPSTSTVISLLKTCNFSNIRLVNIEKTTHLEQRKTGWMTFESLSDYLDENNSELTIEGYPAPKRAIFTAHY